MLEHITPPCSGYPVLEDTCATAPLIGIYLP